MKKIKELSNDEMALFSKPFKQTPTPTIVRNNEAWKILTSSEEFGQKIMRVDCISGSATSGPITRGIKLYRYDNKDEVEGTPINVDMYSLDDSMLSKVDSSFLGHRLSSLP